MFKDVIISSDVNDSNQNCNASMCFNSLNELLSAIDDKNKCERELCVKHVTNNIHQSELEHDVLKGCRSLVDYWNQFGYLDKNVDIVTMSQKLLKFCTVLSEANDNNSVSGSDEEDKF